MIVRRTYVRPTVVRAALDMLWDCMLDLGLRLPGELPWLTIAFVEHHELTDASFVYGKYTPSSFHIELHREMGESEAAVTVAHECRHCWQHRHWPEEDLSSKAKKERDAREYERRAMNRFWDFRRYESAPRGAIGSEGPKLRKVV